MKPPKILRSLTWPWGYVVAAIVSVALCFAVYWLITWPARMSQRAADAEVGQALGKAETQAAHDAIGTQDAALNAATQHETQTRESSDVIHQAPGADVRLDPDLNRVGRERVCQRQAYRDRPECLQQPGRAVPAR